MKKTIALSLVLWGMVLFIQVYAYDMLEEFNVDRLSPDWTWSADTDISFNSGKGFLTVVIPGGKPYDIWNTKQDGMLLLRKDQGTADWTVETGFNLQAKGRGYQVGLVVWANHHLMYFWGLKREIDKGGIRPTGEFMGISDLSRGRKAPNLGTEAKLRIEKTGKELDLQYWDEDSGEFVSHHTYRFNYHINAVGLVARTFSPKGADLKVYFDYFRLLRADGEEQNLEEPADEVTKPTGAIKTAEVND